MSTVMVTFTVRCSHKFKTKFNLSESTWKSLHNINSLSKKIPLILPSKKNEVQMHAQINESASNSLTYFQIHNESQR